MATIAHGSKQGSHDHRGDAYFSWPIWLLSAALLAFVLVVPFSGVAGMLILPVALLGGLCSVFGLVRALHHHHWRRAASMATYIVVLAALFSVPELLQATVGRASNVVHLMSEGQGFDKKLQTHPPGKRPVLAYDWSNVGTDTTYVIYDASGRIAEPKGHVAWSSSELFPFAECAGRVVPIMGNFYRCDY
ncbi:hypothetical protein LXA47_01475 [Massilia sp. P8910]|uniref:Uncharacterized protein n=1 Tax=Massilia antarctica TaxID=2765360 RepID=A0AA49A7S9_9BURK|nr:MULTISPECIES: hypothetical protein [Massilia]CUI03497.1 hypothetical protein BN2497_1771 [Janthinobacterium sp. CG23_2]MCE3602283.1 hypothetical protein [Massilia antarctica]MCY0912336.1 hypothetical protein [Massilia sp. H27-R4]QPI49097.1 hypothetical protein IV454_27085 [Massilia antarctica]CUU27283.1 hypothetical protein BN3177_1771 [Janthinobacterium sp. CG23_2]